METAGLAVMQDDDRDYRNALAAAGYTTPRGAVLFCFVLAVVGGLFGSVVFAMMWNALVPSPEAVNEFIGAVAGVAFGIAVGVVKVRRGNLAALEHVEDREWQRQVRRQLGR